MSDINHVVLIGRMTRDIGGNDFAYTTGGTARLNTSIACNRSYKKDGQYFDEVSYFDVTIWGKTAENLRKYLGKGKQIGIDGHLQQQRWQSQDGSSHSKVVVIADIVQLLGDNTQGNQQQQGGGYQDGDYYDDVSF